MTANVRVADPADWETALALLSGRQPGTRSARLAVRRMLAEARRGDADLSRLTVLESSGQLSAALLCVEAPGDILQLFPVAVAAPFDFGTAAGQLIEDAVRRWMQPECSGQLMQAVAGPDEQHWIDVLRNAGFELLGEVMLMMLPLPVAVDAVSLESDAPEASFGVVEFEPGDDELQRRFERVITATYQDSQDCPELIRRRTVQQALQSHASIGRRRDGWWSLLSVDGTDVGVLLMNELVSEAAAEIAYLGVVSGFRRRRAGQQLIRRAVDLARRAGCSELTVGVDARNTAALGLYRRCGFTLRTRRIALARFSTPGN